MLRLTRRDSHMQQPIASQNAVGARMNSALVP